MARRDPIYIQGQAGALYAYHRRAVGAASTVMLVQPFAEEMNKSRRMFSLLGEALLEVGISSLLLDPFGTGDSAGDFEDALWETWRQDLSIGADYLACQEVPPTAVVSLRAGALLVADWMATQRSAGEQPAKAVFWQPVLKGETWLSQFLRQRSMAAKFSGRNEPVKELRARLATGETLEVAGYSLSPQWADAVDRQHLTSQLSAVLSDITVLELGRTDESEGPAARAIRSDLPNRRVDSAVVSGEAFWTSLEIAEVPALISATVDVVRESSW